MFFILILVYLKFSIEWCNFQALFPELIFLTMGSSTIFEEPYIGISPGDFGMLCHGLLYSGPDMLQLEVKYLSNQAKDELKTLHR